MADFAIEAETPRGVSYKTPKSQVISPPAEDDIQGQVVEGEQSSDDDQQYENFEVDLNAPEALETVTERRLPLSWHGHSAADLQTMLGMARDSRNIGAIDEAEDMFQQVLLGMAHISGKTNGDRVTVAYNLADLYADSSRINDAISVIEEVIQDHLSVYGCEDAKTQQNVLHAVELLNGWNRPADALALISLSCELLNSSSRHRQTRVGEGIASRKGKAVQRSFRNDTHTDLSQVTESILEDASPARIDYGLGVARTHVAAKDRAVEGLILATIFQSENNPDLSGQYLKAYAELLKLYDSLGQADEHQAAFEDALASLKSTWAAYSWDRSEIEAFDFIEAALQLIANALKCGYRTQAWPMFREVADMASSIFQSDDERTVWVLITIGLVYQTHVTWDAAEEWFDEAFSAALANKSWGPKDGIVRSLQNARDHQHFSYVSDEGRPFKTIFGVSGITIRPGRLHLE